MAVPTAFPQSQPRGAPPLVVLPLAGEQLFPSPLLPPQAGVGRGEQRWRRRLLWPGSLAGSVQPGEAAARHPLLKRRCEEGDIPFGSASCGSHIGVVLSTFPQNLKGVCSLQKVEDPCSKDSDEIWSNFCSLKELSGVLQNLTVTGCLETTYQTLAAISPWILSSTPLSL